MYPTDQFYMKQEEPLQSCLLALRSIILGFDAYIEETLKFGVPFFLYKGKMFCYFWIDKKIKEPYIGFYNGKLIDHFLLETGNRKQVRILRISPLKDIDVDSLMEILIAARNVGGC